MGVQPLKVNVELSRAEPVDSSFGGKLAVFGSVAAAFPPISADAAGDALGQMVEGSGFVTVDTYLCLAFRTKHGCLLFMNLFSRKTHLPAAG
jgi:hypothetical protein